MLVFAMLILIRLVLRGKDAENMIYSGLLVLASVQMVLA
jgi:hypothetical protein